MRTRVEHDRHTTSEGRDRGERGQVQVRQHDGDIGRLRPVAQHIRQAVEAGTLLVEPGVLHVRRRDVTAGERADRDRREPPEVAGRATGSRWTVTPSSMAVPAGKALSHSR